MSAPSSPDAFTLPAVPPDFDLMDAEALRVYASEVDFALREMTLDFNDIRIAGIVQQVAKLRPDGAVKRSHLFGPAEARLLLCLMGGQIRTHGCLLRNLGLESDRPEARRLMSLRVHIMRLRRLLELTGGEIICHSGIGYQLRASAGLLKAVPDLVRAG